MSRIFVEQSNAITLSTKQCAQRLTDAERAFRSRWLALTLAGFAVLWVGPALIATVLYVLQHQNGGTPKPWGTVFTIAAVIVIPLAFLVEYLTRGMFVEDAVEHMDDVALPALHRGTATVMLIEVALWGPRMMIGGISRLLKEAGVGTKARPAAAQVLHQLAKRDDGMPAGELVSTTGLSPESFGDALVYLTFHEWVDISKDGSRIWLLAAARKRLKASAAASR